MKLILLVLTLAGTIHLISASKADVQDYVCGSYLESDNPTVYWPTCDHHSKVSK